MKLLLYIIIFAFHEVRCLEFDEYDVEKDLSVESTISSSHSNDLTSSSNKFKSLWREETSDDEDDDELNSEASLFQKEETEDETIKTKRNSFDEDISKDEDSHLSIPKAAALQSSPQSISLGDLNALNRGQIFQGAHNVPNAPMDLSCGMCSRERNLCQIISGIFTRSPLPYGYSVVTPIPVGVCNVTIVEIQKSKNFFALRKKDGTYALNGEWEIQASGTYQVAGTEFTYSASDGTRGEKLESPGPTLEPIDLMIIYQTPNQGIKYEFRVPLPELVSQQSSPRILPVAPNNGANSFNVDANIKNQKNFQNVYSGARRHNNIQTGSQSTMAQSQHPQHRTSFTNPSSSQNSGFPQRPLSPVDNSGQVAGINNWNNKFLPVRAPGAELPGRSPVLNVPPFQQSSTQNFGAVVNTKYPTRISSSGSNLFQSSGGVGTTDNRFQGERFLDPRTLTNRALSDESNFMGPVHSYHSNLTSSNNPSKFKPSGISYPSGSVASGANSGRSEGISGSTNSIHRTRHNHGPRNIQPGPAVGGIGLSPVEDYSSSSESDSTRIFFPNDGETQEHNHSGVNQRRRKKKSKRKKGKKHKNRFHWVFKGLTECSRACGGGNQTSTFSCERRRKEKVVADKYCDDLPQPDHKIFSCNLKPCPAKWVPGEWSSCSTTCGIGIQTRDLHCKQEVSSTLIMMVPEGACVEPKAQITIKECYVSDCPSSDPLWKVNSWSACSVKCGVGTRTREVHCTASGSTRNEITCSHIGTKPTTEEPCDMGSCVERNTWLFTSWSEKCTDACENGIQTRRVTCLNTGLDYDASCPLSSKPETSKFCAVSSECVPQWFAGPWSSCSMSCGSGLETRVVKCLSFKNDEWNIVPEKQCVEENKPSDIRECFLDSCHPLWYTSEWEECSSTCEDGISKRQVKCLDSSQKSSADCMNLKPQETRKCNEDVKCPMKNNEFNLTNHRPFTNETSEDRQWKEVVEKGGSHAGRDSEPEIHEKLLKPANEAKDVFHNDSRNKTDSRYTFVEEEVTMIEKQKNNQDVNPDTDDPNEVEAREKSFEKSNEDTEANIINNAYDDNQQTNELEVHIETGSAINAIPDKDAQGDESISSIQEELEPAEDEMKHFELKPDNVGDGSTESKSTEEIFYVESSLENKNKKDGKKKLNRNIKKDEKKHILTPGPSVTKANRQHVCVDRIKNCHLVFRARLCRLKYYNKLCCNTCKS